MNAKTKLEAVPTPAQLLREAIAQRDNAAKEVEGLRARANLFAPIEAEAAAAQAELQGILQRDAAAMQTWAQGGAIGAAPEPDHKAREEATRKLGQAGAKLSAAGGAKAQIEADTQAANDQYREAQQRVRAAEAEVLGQELLRAAQAMKDAAIAYLKAEDYYFAVRVALFGVDNAKGTAFSALAEPIARPLTMEEQRSLAEEFTRQNRQRLDALCQGDEVPA